MSAPAVPDRALARALRSQRERSRVSQEDVAWRAGLSVAAYARIERGKANPTFETVVRIAGALCMSVVELMQLRAHIED